MRSLEDINAEITTISDQRNVLDERLIVLRRERHEVLATEHEIKVGMRVLHSRSGAGRWNSTTRKYEPVPPAEYEITRVRFRGGYHGTEYEGVKVLKSGKLGTHSHNLYGTVEAKP